MPFILATDSKYINQVLAQVVLAPCEREDQAMLQTLVMEFQLNPNTKVPISALRNCGNKSSTSLKEILKGTAVDDPDLGMDQDLPNQKDPKYDPANDRRWMGGIHGPTSQGFRHMFFGGWKLSNPIRTLQIPFYAIGQAPFRMDLFARKAKALIRAGNIAWGGRLLGWALHYLQDLAQPFHSVQVINFRMVPWSSLFNWPPADAMNRLIRETTRVVKNYHWAFEGYTYERITQGNPYAECLQNPGNFSAIQFDPKSNSPIDLALKVSDESLKIASDLGSTEMGFFGTILRDGNIDLERQNPIRYSEYASRPDLKKPRQELERVTCHALANASLASRLLLEWTFQP